MHIMLDLETLSTASDALIMSIGAARFDLFGDGIEDSFHVGVRYNDLSRMALDKFHIDMGTVEWWFAEDRAEARTALHELPKTDLLSALDGFSLWFGDKSLPVWGNGAIFDNAVLKHAFNVAGMPCPWSYKHDRCYRTIKEMVSQEAYDACIVRPEIAHDALSDAVSQALTLQKIVKHLGWAVVA